MRARGKSAGQAKLAIDHQSLLLNFQPLHSSSHPLQTQLANILQIPTNQAPTGPQAHSSVQLTVVEGLRLGLPQGGRGMQPGPQNLTHFCLARNQANSLSVI